MEIIKCSVKDAPQLAAMNKELIDDEKSNNAMDLADLEERMQDFLRGEYDAYFFEKNSQIVGYALVNPTTNPLYLRQFFIKREFRRQHLGQEAFYALKKYLHVIAIDIDVLPWNAAGRAFWKSLGFSEMYVAMRHVKRLEK